MRNPKSAVHLTCDPNKRTSLFNFADVQQPQTFSSGDGLTVVTAFFNLGKFPKNKPHTFFTPTIYRQWMVPLSHITNPMVAYFDTYSDAEYFRQLRKNLRAENKTIIIKVDRQKLWAFSALRRRIAHIYANISYPKYYPNTVVADYSCAMHAKYEVLQDAMDCNHFRTKYFSWVDIGCFRHLRSTANNIELFSLYLPPNLNMSSVAYGEAIPWSKQSSAKDIFLNNLSWLSGAFFIGSRDVLNVWVREYRFYVEHFISQGLMNTDQQVIYAIVSCYKPQTIIQAYSNNGDIKRWFHLAYECKNAGKRRFL
jgi:hypothetical protein